MQTSPSHRSPGCSSPGSLLRHLPWCPPAVPPVLIGIVPIVNTFSLFLQNLAYEIILTLGQAFEVAYQLALQARKGGHSSTLPESFENKPSKPIPKPRVSIRKSVVSRRDGGGRCRTPPAGLGVCYSGPAWRRCHLGPRSPCARPSPWLPPGTLSLVPAVWEGLASKPEVPAKTPLVCHLQEPQGRRGTGISPEAQEAWGSAP